MPYCFLEIYPNRLYRYSYSVHGDGAIFVKVDGVPIEVRDNGDGTFTGPCKSILYKDSLEVRERYSRSVKNRPIREFLDVVVAQHVEVKAGYMVVCVVAGDGSSYHWKCSDKPPPEVGTHLKVARDGLYCRSLVPDLEMCGLAGVIPDPSKSVYF